MSRARGGYRRAWTAIRSGAVLLLVLLHAAPVLIPGWEAPQADVLGASPILAATGAALDIARLALLAVVATSVVRGVGKSPSNQWIAAEMLDM